MYQVPVQRLDRIRTSRKRVKAILTDIGLNSCQDFLKDQTSCDDGERCFENTEWNDLTDCYQTKRKKKWCYRTQPLCCSLCWFSCRSWYTFRSHIQRCHEEERDLASLSPCTACAYISRPDLLVRHAKLFHGPPQAAGGTNNGNKVNKTLSKTSVCPTQAGVRVTTVGQGGDKYSCASCGFHDSLLYVMRKHVLLNHCKSLLQRYYGRRLITPNAKGAPALNDDPGGKVPSAVVGQSMYYCCVCKMPAETSEHLLYHLLSSAKHQELQAHIKPLLVEHCSAIAKAAPAGSKSSEPPHLAPRALQQVVSLVSKGMAHLPPVNGKPPPPKKAVLLARHSQPTALVCAATTGGQQIMLGNQKAALRTIPCQSSSNKPLSFVMSSGAQGKQIPLTVTMTGSGQGQTQQVLLPAGLTLNLGGKIGSVGSPGQPLVFSQSQAGKIEVKVTTAGQQMVLAQGQATNAGAGAPQTLLSDGKAAAVGQSMVLTQGKGLGPSMVLAPSNSNSFAAMAPNQSLLIGGQVGSVQPMMLNQGLSLQTQQPGGSLLSSQAVSFVATGNKVGPGQPLMLNQGLSLQSSQSTVRLIPTGNKVNGMPTYTLAAVQMAVPVQSTMAQPPVLVTVPPQAPPAPPVTQAKPSTIPTKPAVVMSSTGQVVAAKSQFVTRSLFGKLECVRCKSAFSDQGLYQHLLHGLHCLLCPLVFYSLRQLRSHCDEAHSLAEPANRERLQREHRLATTKDGRLVARMPTLYAKVPKDMLGCKELHLALVPKDKDREVMHLHLTEKLAKSQALAVVSSPPLPLNSSCPFCQDPRPLGPGAYEQHLRQQHHVVHTIHAILKTPAFKCVYCLGVYTDQSSMRTVSIHVQRCRCAPRSVKEAERLLNPDVAIGGVSREGLEAMPSTPEPYVNTPPEVPAGLDQRPPSERKLFLHKYFLKKPYPTRKEIEFLVHRLKLSQSEVVSLFNSKRKRCLQDCGRRGLRVLLGFNSCLLKSVKHGLILPRSPVTRGLRSNRETQTPVVECKQEPTDPVEIAVPLSDHPYAERQSPPGSPLGQNGGPDRTESGKQP
ncbi:Activity-dependent neuroprotector homeobox protein 2 [Merluccius polli]|uniref:Activity-dependent neuroprotector homeobox protein 2 n=1 Tax=Merluccius polli TaxID=89951 RepID=A0AA47P890_MERPO|nr:Activity-dependent neuroprotector homeobox protein 2 [Merluccius polli]